MSHYRWNLFPPVSAEETAAIPDLPPLIVRLLRNRGITDAAQAELFINADERLSFDPELLPDMQAATARIFRALFSAESIAVYGDFDVDGITGAALLTQGLQALGGNITPYIPHRLKEGHGLNTSALEQLQQQGVSLVVTVDCGVTGVAPVKKAKRKGLDIVITDHHTPLDELPQAVAVVDPRRIDSKYPFAELAGVGVAFKLLQAIYRGMGKEQQLEQFIDLVAMGTVADMMPILGENRYLVKRGLELIKNKPRIGIQGMAQFSRLDINNISSESISWIMAPRINAAGRLENAMTSYDLLTTESADEAKALAQTLEERNSQRQQLTAKAFARAREQVIAEGVSPLLITSDYDYQGGILGLVAGRLSSEFYRPSIAIRLGEKYSSASCRSIPEFNIIEAINRYGHLMTRFGGHAQAAGFTLLTENLPLLQQELCRIAAEELAEADLRPRIDIDAEALLDELGDDIYNKMQMLAPFGQGNPLPTFISRNVKVADCRYMGDNGDHLRLKLKQGKNIWDAVAFGLGSCAPQVNSDIDIVYNLEMNRWNGEENLRLTIQDMAASGKP